jgi:hypothetical protein
MGNGAKGIRRLETRPDGTFIADFYPPVAASSESNHLRDMFKEWIPSKREMAAAVFAAVGVFIATAIFGWLLILVHNAVRANILGGLSSDRFANFFAAMPTWLLLLLVAVAYVVLVSFILRRWVATTRAAVPTRQAIQPPSEPPAIVHTAAPVEARPEIAGPSRPAQDERIFVDLTISELTKPFREHTAVQAEKLFAIYRGKWYRVEGTIRNVATFSDKEVSVVVDTDQGPPNLAPLYFDAEWSGRLEILPRGSRLKAIGVIARANDGCISLDHCELVS